MELLGKAVQAAMEVQTIERVAVEAVLLLLAQMLLLPLAVLVAQVLHLLLLVLL
jgi:hypothetical protein